MNRGTRYLYLSLQEIFWKKFLAKSITALLHQLPQPQNNVDYTNIHTSALKT